MTTGMTIELWLMVGLFVGAALIFCVGAFAFAIWHQRSLDKMNQSTSTSLKSVNPIKEVSPRDTHR